ncbi:transcriptional regulator [Micromonospora sp. CA-240977]|uniref:transcriptional regulator n=1 Tax=Micromonospora sp. CA-240977 TaxID=3239957 RepID=UPI003D8DD2E9
MFDDVGVHPPQMRAQARALRARGHTIHSVARTLALPYTTVRHWCADRPERAEPGAEPPCFRCRPDVENPTDPAAYAYLLGRYLGGGQLTVAPTVPVLRIAGTASRPQLADACAAAMRAVLPTPVRRTTQHCRVWVESSGAHWPCLLPQHGPDQRHDRPIVLTDWQRPILERHPGDLLRGLFHSAGRRAANRVTVRGRAYVYPCYVFGDESTDLLRLCQWSLDLLGVTWRMNRHNSLSVARRGDVAEVDRHVGPRS